MTQAGYCQFSALGRDRGFSVATELFGSVSQLGPLCCNMVLRLQASLGLDRRFPGHDRVVFYWFSVATRVLPMS